MFWDALTSAAVSVKRPARTATPMMAQLCGSDAAEVHSKSAQSSSSYESRSLKLGSGEYHELGDDGV